MESKFFATLVLCSGFLSLAFVVAGLTFQAIPILITLSLVAMGLTIFLLAVFLIH